MEKRESELTSIDAWISGPKREPWPPTQPHPGVAFRRIRTGQNSYARTNLHRDSQLVPYVEDERAFYRNCPTSRFRLTEPGDCRACKGARFMTLVRRDQFGRLVSTGKITVCPVCGGSGLPGGNAGGSEG